MKQLNLKDLFATQAAGYLATADSTGKVNSAVFGSCRLLTADTVAIGLGDNRSLANLQENPSATLLFVTPGSSPLNWQGARIYLEVSHFVSGGELFDNVIAEIEKEAGKMAAHMITTVAVFQVTEVRPLIDFS